MINPSTIWSGMSKVGRCIKIRYGIKAFNKVLNHGKRSFLFELLGQVMNSQIWGDIERKAQ